MQRRCQAAAAASALALKMEHHRVTEHRIIFYWAEKNLARLENLFQEFMKKWTEIQTVSHPLADVNYMKAGCFFECHCKDHFSKHYVGLN